MSDSDMVLTVTGCSLRRLSASNRRCPRQLQSHRLQITFQRLLFRPDSYLRRVLRRVDLRRRAPLS